MNGKGETKKAVKKKSKKNDSDFEELEEEKPKKKPGAWGRDGQSLKDERGELCEETSKPLADGTQLDVSPSPFDRQFCYREGSNLLSVSLYQGAGAW